MGFVVGDRDFPIAGGDPVGHPGVVGLMPLHRRLWAGDPAAFAKSIPVHSKPRRSIERGGSAEL